jgi:hypothetical protein
MARFSVDDPDMLLTIELCEYGTRKNMRLKIGLQQYAANYMASHCGSYFSMSMSINLVSYYLPDLMY